MSKIVKTEIKETLNGHQVRFTIGVQTFSLMETLTGGGMGSKEHAEWYEKMLNKAFDNYEEIIKEELGQSK